MSVASRVTGKEWVRARHDFYATIDPRAVAALRPHIVDVGFTYAEPCAGDGDLIELLRPFGVECAWAMDIEPRRRSIAVGNAFDLSADDVAGVDCFITNPPWSRPVLHGLIVHLSRLRPTWMLFDAGWMFSGQARPYLATCTDIVAVGRLRWFPPKPKPMRATSESDADYKKRCRKARGDDATSDCAWYRFDASARQRCPRFWPKIAPESV